MIASGSAGSAFGSTSATRSSNDIPTLRPFSVYDGLHAIYPWLFWKLSICISILQQFYTQVISCGPVQKFSRKLHSLQSLWGKCDSPEPVDLGWFRANHLKSWKILYTYCIFFVLLFIVYVHITHITPKLIPFFHMFFSCQGHATGTGPPRHSDPIGCPGSAGRAAAGSSAAPPLLGCLQLDEWCKNPLFNGLV